MTTNTDSATGFNNIAIALEALNVSWTTFQRYNLVNPENAHAAGFTAGLEFAQANLTVSRTLAERLYVHLSMPDSHKDHERVQALLVEVRQSIEASKEAAVRVQARAA